MTNPLTLDFVQENMKEFGTVEQARSNRIRIKSTTEKIRDAIKTTRELLGCDRLITISAADNSRTLELIYHLTGPHRMVVSLAIELPRDAPKTPTTSDILIPAGIYERQIHDLFGILFLGNPNLKRIILNEDWPENEYPLRKDWKLDPKTFYGGIKAGRI
jgi:NADH-quinone oxidoreductase subunit C